MNVDLRHGDCVELMRQMPDCSVDSIVTDPPYGLEFMGKEWDKFRVDDTGTNRHRGDRAGKHGEIVSDKDRPSTVAYGGGKRPQTYRCVGCGKRDQFRNEHDCRGEISWKKELIDAFSAPPTMLAFEEWFRTIALECIRVLKPGGHLLAFGGTRTYHRMACAIEDAGFEIRDSIHWVYGSGFPKSLNVGKAIDKAAGAEREVVGERTLYGTAASTNPVVGAMEGVSGAGATKQVAVTAPATEEARRWEGWGTALKPAHEPVVVARKPLSGTVASNVLSWGTGGLNIDGCRVATDDRFGGGSNGTSGFAAGYESGDGWQPGSPSGRWPANIVLDGAAAAALDQQSGTLAHNPPAVWQSPNEGKGEWGNIGARNAGSVRGGYGDRGGASRFFTQADFGPEDWPFVYQAKPSRKERNAGLEGLEQKPTGDTASPISNRKCRKCGLVKFAQPHCVCAEPEWEEAKTTANANSHPTVKPVALMRHLVRLVTPPEGTVLDPFAGSGTTLVAAVLEGMNAIGCEMTEEYLPIIEGRVAWAQGEVEARAADPEQPTLL